MNLLKIVTVLNWIVISILGFLVIAETLAPTKGGDAAGRGMGQAIYYLAIIALVALLGLNLLPFNWAKYTAFALIVLPILFIVYWPKWRDVQRKMQQEARYRIEDAKPIFKDAARDQIARAIREGHPEKVKKLLQTPVEKLNEGGGLLSYAIAEASSTPYRPKEKTECVRLLFDAGAKYDSTKGMDVPPHMAVADVGNATLLRMLLEHGADANAYHKYFKRPILFEAIGGYQDPVGAVRVLLEFGADPNSTAVFGDDTGPVSPLWRAAELERWGVCAALLEKGADPDFKTAQGASFRSVVQSAQGRKFPSEGYSIQADYDRLKASLQ